MMTPRQDALFKGMKRYYGSPCRNCAGTLRIASNGNCLMCFRQRGKNRNKGRANG